MNKRVRKAIDKFSGGYNCAQSVLYSFCDKTGLESETALRIACAFGAGMGREEEVCGAVTGGLMVLGLLNGRGEKEPRSVTDSAYRITRDFMGRFSARHGTYRCRELLKGCELTTEEGQNEFREKDLLRTVCLPCVRSAVEILEEIMEKNAKD